MNTSEKFKTIRLALGFSQQKLADLFKVHRTRIAKIETNDRPLPIELAKKLITICTKEGLQLGTKKKPQEVTLDYLYREDDIEDNINE